MPGLPPQNLFEEVYRRHGHRCPMSTLGGRLGHAARTFLNAVPDEQLVVIYHARTCAIDGVSVATGCSEDDGCLRVREEGRHLLHLFDRRSGDGVAVFLRRRALDIAWEYRRASEALESERDGLETDELGLRERELEGRLDSVLDRLRTLPDEELLVVQPLISCVQGE